MKIDDLVEDIFSKKSIFEKEVLDVVREHDRLEIINILSVSIVRDILKEHLDFGHIQDLSDFTLEPVVNIIFKEIANEWIAYATEILSCSREFALEVLQLGRNAKFLHFLADDYARHCKPTIYEEIANSFIDLLASMDRKSKKVMLVNAVIHSDLIANRSMLGINSFEQLHKCIINAKNLKNIELTKLQNKLSDILKELSDNATNPERRELLSSVLKQYERKNEEMREQKLEAFDPTLQRVKRAIENALKNGAYSL